MFFIILGAEFYKIFGFLSPYFLYLYYKKAEQNVPLFLNKFFKKFFRRNFIKLSDGDKVCCAWFGSSVFPF